eukprot:scaffold945_cov82-Cylindrotheca_fusiformis.AAC.7
MQEPALGPCKVFESFLFRNTLPVERDIATGVSLLLGFLEAFPERSSVERRKAMQPKQTFVGLLDEVVVRRVPLSFPRGASPRMS